MVMISCPECQQRIDLVSDPNIGQQTTCQSCNTDFVVTWLFPVNLDYLDDSDFVEIEDQPLDNSLKT
jgi:hypothetical protein